MSEKPNCYSYIRLSSPEQLKGDSLARQLDLSEKYAKEKGLIIDSSLSMKDLGLSAYKGDHKKKGALGIFLNAVKNGDIPQGSYLLVESLDRLSREQVLDAFYQFSEIIRNGITIVTLADGMEYSEVTLKNNFGNLMISLTIMSRAYEESLQKSKRILAAWDSKRKNIGQAKITTRCPAWMMYNISTSKFEKIESRCEIIEYIFEDYLNGKGVGLIAKNINQRNIPAWQSKNGWYKSYINKILRNRSVLGEFQPYTSKSGKREAVGNAVKDYFPQVISEKIFYMAQAKIKNNVSRGGKTGKVANLFGGIAKCKYCGSPMRLVDKGKPPKGGKYLVCDKARRGCGCHYASFRYPSFEKGFLEYCLGLDFRNILGGSVEKNQEKVISLKESLIEVEGSLESIEGKIGNLLASLEEESDLSIQSLIKARISENLSLAESLEQEKERYIHEMGELESVYQRSEDRVESLKELLRLMEDKAGDDLIAVRLKLRSELRQVVEKVELAPLGEMASEDEVLGIIKDIDSETGLSKVLGEEDFQTVVKGLLDRLCNSGRFKMFRCFTIFFKTGDFRVLSLDDNNQDSFSVVEERVGGEYRLLCMKDEVLKHIL